MHTDLTGLQERGIGVSGGGGNLGTALCLGLAAGGAIVVACGRHPEPLEALVEQASRSGLAGRIIAEPADLSRDEDIEAVLDRLEKEAGAVDGWVNNAFGAPAQARGQLTRQGTLAVLESGLANVMLATQAVARRMHRRDGRRDAGSIVNVASMYGLVSPQPQAYDGCSELHSPPAYGAAKAGVIQLTRDAACHLAPRGIRVNCVSPGPFPSPEILERQAFIEALKARVPLGRVGGPAELVGPVAFLLSDASSFVTGHNLIVDGGWTAQ